MLGRSNGARISADRWSVTSAVRRSDHRQAEASLINKMACNIELIVS